nr:MAG TPA: hypothetical protein [Crassvirales sp.]
MFFSYTINYNLCTFQFAKVIKRNHLYNNISGFLYHLLLSYYSYHSQHLS